MTIIKNIVGQHASEAAYLWSQCQRALHAPHYLRWELIREQDRLEAHLDGLRIAGEAGWDIVQKQLEASTGPGEVFTAAYLAYESGRAERIDHVLNLAAPVVALHPAVISAFDWQPAAARHLPALWNSPQAGLRRIGLGAAAILRTNPGLALEKALFDQDLSLRAYALSIVGRLGYPAWAAQLRLELKSPALSCRFAAAWSLARLTGEPAALAELQTIALTESVHRLPALHMLLRRLEPAAARKFLALLRQMPGTERLALFGIGVWGDPADVPYLLEKMQHTPLARLAGEAFTFITGLILPAHNFDGPIPEDHEPVPQEDPLDDRVDSDPDENLPWPLVDKIRDWWQANRSRFQEGTRYLVGEPLSEARCQKILIEGYQRQRHYAALELSLRQPSQPMLEVTTRQK